MIMATVNEATGEVSQTIAGKEYKFKATMSRMAEYQSKLAVPGLGVTMLMLRESDPRAIFHGLMCLCVSGNAQDFEDMLLTKHMSEAKDAVITALNAGLPSQPEKTSKKSRAAKQK